MENSVNKMRCKFFSILAIFVLPVLPLFSASATLVVQDFGAYAKMAQQIAQVKEIADGTIEQIRQLEQMEKYMTGNMRFGNDLRMELGKYRNILQKVTRSVDNFQLPSGRLASFDDVEDIEQVLGEIYDNSREGNLAYEMKKKYRQKNYKSQISLSEATIAGMNKEVAELEELSVQMDAASDLAQKMDINNKLLHKMVSIQTKIMNLLAHSTRSVAAETYEGIDKEEEDLKKQEISGPERIRRYIQTGMGNKWKEKMPCGETAQRHNLC